MKYLIDLHDKIRAVRLRNQENTGLIEKAKESFSNLKEKMAQLKKDQNKMPGMISEKKKDDGKKGAPSKK